MAQKYRTRSPWEPVAGPCAASRLPPPRPVPARPDFRVVSPRDFVEARVRAGSRAIHIRPGKAGDPAKVAVEARLFLTPKSADDLDSEGATAFLNGAGDAGFALAPGGGLHNLFSLRGQGAGTRALVQAIALGARHLSAIGEGLVDYYTRFGWSEVRREAFDSCHAPKGWSCDLLGTPPVVFMEYRTATFSLPNDVRNTR